MKGRSITIAVAVALGLLWSTFSGDVFNGFESAFPYSRSLAASLSDVVVMMLLLAVASARAPSALIDVMGVAKSPVQPLVWAALLFVPAVLLCFFLAPVAAGLTTGEILWKGFGGPFFEEIVYRGLAVGALMRLAGWRLLPACLLPALFFGAVHAYQGATPMDVLGAVAITGLGGLFFGWLFWRWGFNLWPPILLHAGLNLLWMIFALGETAVGGWLGNAIRAAIIIGAILLTLRMVPKPTKTA